MSHEIKPHWGTIGYSAMNVPLLIRTFVCKVFCARVLAIPTKTGSPFYAPAMRISSVYYLGFVAVTHLCGISMLHDLRVSVQVCTTGQLIQNWCTSVHGVPQKLQERLCDAIQRWSYIRKNRNSETNIASLPSIPWALNFEGEKANKASNNTLNNRGLLISDEKEKECEEVVCPITQHCVRGVCVCLPGNFC